MDKEKLIDLCNSYKHAKKHLEIQVMFYEADNIKGYKELETFKKLQRELMDLDKQIEAEIKSLTQKQQ